MQTTLPFSYYVDPRILARESERVFGRYWQYVGHAGLVADPGSVAAVEAAFRPVVLTRDREGALHAFLNVCRHRGARLVDGCERRSTIQCPYHAWTYDLDGRLRAAPRSDREDTFDAQAHSLVALAVDTWGPFVFVNPAPDPTPLAEALGELPDLVASAGLDLGRLRFHSRAESRYRANWKICCENFLECYHCQIAHPGLVEVLDVSEDAYRLEEGRLFSSQYGPLKARPRHGFDPSGEIRRGQFHFLFPNLTINVTPGRPNLSIGPIIPEAPDRTARWLDYFFGADVDEAWIRELLTWDAQVGSEDASLVERVQRGIGTAGIERGVLFRSERLIAHFDRLLETALADGGREPIPDSAADGPAPLPAGHHTSA